MSRSTSVATLTDVTADPSITLVAVSTLAGFTIVATTSSSSSSAVSTSSLSSSSTTTLQTTSTTTVVAQSTAGNSATPVASIVGGTLGGLAIVCLFIFGLLFIRRRDRDPEKSGPLQKLGPPPHPSITPFPPHPEVSQSDIPTTTSHNHVPNIPPTPCKHEKGRQTSPANVDVPQVATSSSVYSSSVSPPQPPDDPPPSYGV